MKTVVITGGSDGLGKAIAARLSAKYKVIIISRDQDELARVSKEIGCECRVCDVRDYSEVEKTVESIGYVDCLINNAGIWLQGALDETDPERIREVLDVNTLGTINFTKAVMPNMKRQKSGRIINVISQAGLNVRAGWPIYSASKFAVTGFTKSMQQELEPFGITVTGLYPSTINTEMFAKAGVAKDVTGALRPDDIAKTIEFILSFDSSVTFPEIGIKNIRIN